MIEFLTSKNIKVHIQEIRKYGYKKFIIKSIKLIFFVLKFFYFILFCVIILTLRKIVLIRFGLLETNAIGHYACSTDMYLAERKLTDKNFLKKKVLDIWHTEENICNNFLHKIRKKQFLIMPRLLISPLYFYFSKIEKLEDHIVPIRNNENYRRRHNLPNQFTDYKNILNSYETEIKLTNLEIKNCKEILGKKGINNFDRIITIHNRDSFYNNEDYESDRNCKIKTFYSTIKYLISNNYQIIRIGKSSNQKIQIPGVFDYTTSEIKNDILDFFLCSITNLHIGCSSGLSAIPKIFKRDIVWSNVTFNEGPDNFDEEFIYIPKIIINKTSKKDVLIKTNLDLHYFLSNTTKFDYIDNSDDEILELVKEKLLMMSGKWKKPYDYDFLQNKYKLLYPLNISKFTKGKVSYYYLKKHIKDKIL